MLDEGSLEDLSPGTKETVRVKGFKKTKDSTDSLEDIPDFKNR